MDPVFFLRGREAHPERKRETERGTAGRDGACFDMALRFFAQIKSNLSVRVTYLFSSTPELLRSFCLRVECRHYLLPWWGVETAHKKERDRAPTSLLLLSPLAIANEQCNRRPRPKIRLWSGTKLHNRGTTAPCSLPSSI